MLTDEKFCEAAMKFVLIKDTEGKHFTLDEYRTLIESTQTDKDGNVVYLYTTDPVAQYSYIKTATDRGYNVLQMDGQLDSHFIGLLESKLEKARFVRVDSDVIDNLIPSSDRKAVEMASDKRAMLSTLFRSQLPKIEKAEFIVSFEALSPEANPVLITQSEYMRRMKDMAAMQPGMSFYGELPDSYNLIVNTEQPVIKKIIESADAEIMPRIVPMNAIINENNEKIAEIRKAAKDGKPTEEEENQIKSLEETATHNRKESEKEIASYASTQPLVKQTIDLALLANGLLKGSELSEFISRSVKLL
jgi:molecular chaperone HtpG